MDDGPSTSLGGTAAPPTASRARRVPRWVAALAAPLLIVAAYGAERAYHAGAVARGVVVAGLPLAGRSRDEAALLVREAADRRQTDRSRVVLRDRVFDLAPADVAFEVDVDATIDAAMAVSREGGALEQVVASARGLFARHDVPLVATLDRSALDALVADWEREAVTDPPFEGAVVVSNGRPAADPPRPGSAVDRDTAAARVLDALRGDRRDAAALPTHEVPPRRAREAVLAAVERARALVGGPVELTYTPAPIGEEPAGGAEPRSKNKRERAPLELTLAPSKDRLVPSPPRPDAPALAASTVRVAWSAEDLVGALRGDVAPDAPEPRLAFDAGALEARLADARAAIESPPEDARVRINDDDRVTIVPSRAGRLLIATDVAAAVLAAAGRPSRAGELPVSESVPPAFGTDDARALGLASKVSEFTTRHPCCQPRVQNIHRIADLLDGRLVRPGETFSVNTAVGERTTQNGFVLAPSIGDGEMVDTVGGGVSQLATTLFNAVFHGGYDIVERQPHSFYFSRYPMGHEATLSWPKPDLVFRNDTTAVMLLHVTYTEKSVTAAIYGDSGGRKVKAEVSRRMDFVAPPVELTPNRELEPDEEDEKEAGAAGWSVIVGRRITYPDGTHKEERRKVTYKPRPRRLEVHPCRIPKGQEGYTGERCPKREEEGSEEIAGEGGAPP
jgi:vancomycin resistance protein YoaR